MLKITKELHRESGGKIQAGAIIDHQVIMDSKSEQAKITFKVYYSSDTLNAGNKPIPHHDIREFIKDGNGITGGLYKLPKDFMKRKFNSVQEFCDMIGKEFVEEGFLGEGSTEIVGTSILEEKK